MDIKTIAYHRNGVGGESFFVATFTEDGRNLVAVLFPEWDDTTTTYTWSTSHNPRCAVLDADLVGQGEVRFGYNSFRGDFYADRLLAAANTWLKYPETGS